MRFPNAQSITILDKDWGRFEAVKDVVMNELKLHPEEFTLKTAKRGIYTVYVNYYSESR